VDVKDLVAYGILGRTALRINGDLDEGWGPPRLRAMLATLLLHTGRAMPIETLVAWVWPEAAETPKDPAATFHTYATRIRRSLRQLSGPTELRAENGCYRLDLDKSLIDYHRFRALVGRAREHARAKAHPDAAECAAHALDLWRGRGLDDLASQPARDWRNRVLRDEWVPANVLLIQALIELGEFHEALGRLDDLRADHGDDVTLAKLRLSTLHGLSRYSDETAYYLGMRRQFLADVDDQAAENLREHHENLRRRTTSAKPPPVPDEPPVPHQLPRDIGEFVGRRHLLDQLDAADPGGVLVIDGMAGVGKTALAIHWGHRVRHRFPGGDLYVNLNGFSDNARITQSTVVDGFLIALGRTPADSLRPRERELLLQRLLASRPALIVLDNASSTAHVRDLVALLPSCSIVVTSRQQLTGLSTATGVRRVHVDGMAPDEAAGLLAALLGDHHRIDADDQARLAAMCGGLPLVITVLAQHIASRPAAQAADFARQLDLRQLLTEIGEDGDGSATAETFFLWSYRALPSAEQRLFRLLGLNPSPDIGEDTVLACDGRSRAEVRRSLRILVAAHLLEQPDAYDRYRFHDLIREFARHRVEVDEPPSVRTSVERRLLDHYLGTARQAHRTLYPGNLQADEFPLDPGLLPVTFADGESARTWFDRERVNLVAAIHHAAANDYHEHAWRLTDAVGTFLDRQGYYDDSRTVREVAVRSARAAGHREGEASSLVCLGMVEVILGDLAGARENLDAALALVEADDNERGQSSALYQLGGLELVRGNPAAAVEFYQRALEIAQRMQDDEALCWLHCRTAQALRMLDEHGKALIHLNQSLIHAQRVGDESAQASGMVAIGSVCRDQGDYFLAVAHCEQALRLVESMPIPDLAIMTDACVGLAEIHHAQGDIEAATKHILRAIDMAQHTHNTTAEAHAQNVYGAIQHAAGEPAAKQTWLHAAALYESIGNTSLAAAIRRKSTTPRGR
jgi:tetratricopeptide (TPR) repeat protein/DNA-binding SARP family transcriptional activator